MVWHEGIHEPSPMQLRWVLQAEVVEAVQALLASNPNCTAEDVVNLVISTSQKIIRYIRAEVRQPLENSKYVTDGKLDTERLAADLQGQREWLRKYNDVPPMPTPKMSRQELSIVRDYYQKKHEGRE